MATTKLAHEHFCFICYGRTSRGVANKGGWWRCTAKPCTRNQSELCKVHEARLAKHVEHKLKAVSR